MKPAAGIPRLSRIRVIDGYARVKDALRVRGLRPAQHDTESAPVIGGTLITLHGAEHSRRRRLHSRLFTDDALLEYEEHVLEPVVDRTFARLRADRDADGRVRTDLVDLGGRLLLEVAGQVIGLHGLDDPVRAARLMQLFRALSEGASVEWSTRDHAAVVAEAEEAKAEFWRDFVAPARHDRAPRGQPDDTDLLALLDGDPEHTWTDEEILREAILYLVAAIGTTSALIVHVVDELHRWLAERPAAGELVQDPEFLRRAALEALRLHVPTTALLRRSDAAITRDSGLAIAPGEVVALDLGGANRDHEVLGPEADVFDPFRDLGEAPPYGHAFGGGAHKCIGRALALPTARQAGPTRLGISVRVLLELYAGGVQPDPRHVPERLDAHLDIFATYPVVLTSL